MNTIEEPLPELKKTPTILIILLSFSVPIIMLYLLEPNSFFLSDPTQLHYGWKGRIMYLFFLWLLFLEVILSWEKLIPKNLASLEKWRISAMCITMAVPILYVTGYNFLGLESVVLELGKQVVTPLGGLLSHWPISLEYLIFFTFFVITIWLAHKINGLKTFSVSLFFLGGMGTIYMIDTLYPYGAFTPFQALVPLTASLAAQVLSGMGYKTRFMPYLEKGTPVLRVENSAVAQFGVGWPCAGVQSLFIYTFTILLFLKNAPFSVEPEIIRVAIRKGLKSIGRSTGIVFSADHSILRNMVTVAETFLAKILGYSFFLVIFAVGALGTYLVNVLRIVSIFTIALNQGREAALLFHDFYGELYSITWIVAYLMIILLIPIISEKLSALKAKL